MFGYYESISEIQCLLDRIENAIDKKFEIIEFKDDFERMSKYRIFYNVEDLLSYKELELYLWMVEIFVKKVRQKKFLKTHKIQEHKNFCLKCYRRRIS